MEENVYKEACNVYSSCNEDANNDYEEACTVSQSRVSTRKRTSGLNLEPRASDLAKEPGSSGSLSKRQAADPGPASAETAGYIPGVGLRSPAMKMSDLKLTVQKLDRETKGDLKDLKLSVNKLDQKTTDDLSGLKLAFNKSDQKTTDDLSDLKLSVLKLDTKTADIQANVSGWIHRQQKMKEDLSAKLVENEEAVNNVAARVTQLTKSGLEKEKILQRLEKLEDNMKNKQDKPEKERAPIRLPATCPDGYKKYREVCYKAFDVKKTFSKSSETCRADGGTLAMPRDAGIDAFLVSLIKPVCRFCDFWIGLHDKRQEGKWEWIDGTALGTGYNRCSRQVTGRPYMESGPGYSRETWASTSGCEDDLEVT
ncbi:PREDICTED: C-type lectin domain family 4 member M-like [Branchiostoma belcheri]|uniref:C-type lectin domain family 4 member M-like n=1 Tax=Branchiostoma belcheri TaxID=7741 RepID=A0A6P5AAA9_BRABE|nr:PREDICTED: C-type lectin domain family 4 member M-like [Branchiostoma belcheri]